MTLRADIIAELTLRQVPDVWELAGAIGQPVPHVTLAVIDMRAAGLLGEGDPLRLTSETIDSLAPYGTDTDGDTVDNDCDDIDNDTEDEPPEDAVHDEVIDPPDSDDDLDTDGDGVVPPDLVDLPLGPEIVGDGAPTVTPTATAPTTTATEWEVSDPSPPKHAGNTPQRGDAAFAGMLANMVKGRRYKRDELDGLAELGGHPVSWKTLQARLRKAVKSGHLVRRGATTSTRYSLPDEEPPAPLELADKPKPRRARKKLTRLDEVAAIVKERGIVTIAEVCEVTGLGDSQISRHLRDLVIRDLVIRQGSRLDNITWRWHEHHPKAAKPAPPEVSAKVSAQAEHVVVLELHPQLAVWINALLATGLYGRDPAEVIERLACAQLRAELERGTITRSSGM